MLDRWTGQLNKYPVLLSAYDSMTQKHFHALADYAVLMMMMMTTTMAEFFLLGQAGSGWTGQARLFFFDDWLAWAPAGRGKRGTCPLEML